LKAEDFNSLQYVCENVRLKWRKVRAKVLKKKRKNEKGENNGNEKWKRKDNI
jgi:hypothetical protein